MSRDTIIDPQWEEEERRREAERESRRRPKRTARRERAAEGGISAESDTIAPWDDPPEDDVPPRRSRRAFFEEESQEAWLTVEGEDEPSWIAPEEELRPGVSRRRDRPAGGEDAPSEQGDGNRGGRRRGKQAAEDGKTLSAHPEANETDGAGETFRPPSRWKQYIGSLLSGNILSKGEVRRLYPYLLFVAFLMLLYISNVFRMQQLHRREETLTKQVKELRAKSLTMSAMRMNSTRQSEIIRELQRRGIPLEESLEPPRVVK